MTDPHHSPFLFILFFFGGGVGLKILLFFIMLIILDLLGETIAQFYDLTFLPCSLTAAECPAGPT